MQTQSYSSFYTQMRQAYMTTPQPASFPRSTPEGVVQVPSSSSAPRYQQPRYHRVDSDVLEPTSEMTQRTPSYGGSMPSALTGVQQKLAAIQSRNGVGEVQHPLQPPRQYRYQEQQREGDLMCAALHPRQNVVSKPAEAEMSPLPPAMCSTSSGCLKQGERTNNGPTRVVAPPISKVCGGNNNDENLTPHEMNFLRVIEFSVPLTVYAQLDPGSKLVSVCEQAIAKIFPYHLVLIRPEGIAAVELVIAELCELNEDGVDGALDCVIQPKGTSWRQLIRIFCSDASARGALFKLLCARRTLLGEGPSDSKKE